MLTQVNLAGNGRVMLLSRYKNGNTQQGITFLMLPTKKKIFFLKWANTLLPCGTQDVNGLAEVLLKTF